MSLKRDSAYLFAVRLGSLAVGTVSGILVARVLGPEGKGVIHLVTLLPQFVASVGGMGMRAAATYSCGRGASPRAVQSRIYALALVLSALYVVLGLVFLEPLRTTALKGIQEQWTLVALSLIPVYLFWYMADSVLHGTLRFGSYSLVQVLSLSVRIILLVLLLVVVPIGLAGGVWAYAGAAVIPAIVAVALAWRGPREGTPVRTGEMLRYGLQVHWGNVAQRANLSLDSFLINPFVGTAGVGFYSIAVMLAQLVWQAPSALSQVLFPRVAASRPGEAAPMSAFLCRTAFAAACAGGLGLLVLGDPLIRLVYGSEFAPATPALWALLPGVVGLSVGLVLAQYLAGIGRPALNSVASVIALAVNLAALFLLVPRFGIVGAGVATSLAYITQASFVAGFFLRVTGTRAHRLVLPDGEDLRTWRDGAGNALARLRRRGS